MVCQLFEWKSFKYILLVCTSKIGGVQNVPLSLYSYGENLPFAKWTSITVTQHIILRPTRITNFHKFIKKKLIRSYIIIALWTLSCSLCSYTINLFLSNISIFKSRLESRQQSTFQSMRCYNQRSLNHSQSNLLSTNLWLMVMPYGRILHISLSTRISTSTTPMIF